jgi:DNA-binding winged helix-turn-helix (wHTH) protein
MRVKLCAQCPFTPGDFADYYDPKAELHACAKCDHLSEIRPDANNIDTTGDQMRESPLRGEGERASDGLPPPPKETMLRVGSLELDLLDRAARRNYRRIDLLPREFKLLKYMMQRSDTLLTRALLYREVWHYTFVPETNLVDVHMSRLRRKVDGANEVPMIRNIRGVGFVLSANPDVQDWLAKSAEPPINKAVERSRRLADEALE